MKVLCAILSLAVVASAHFQMLIPSQNIVENQEKSKLDLLYAFAHPFERSGMKMQKPNKAGVFIDNEEKNLLSSLKQTKHDAHKAWKTTFTCKTPAMHIFYVDPKPYFEPAEGKFIRHQTKTIVDAYGTSEGWDKALGLKAEIIPLTRPYGLYKGNIFSAKVLYKGKIAPNVEVEVELFNKKGFHAPTESHITQVVKTDNNGIFHFVMPVSGWWGFAALIDDDVTIKHEEKDYPVELGAVLWIHADELR